MNFSQSQDEVMDLDTNTDSGDSRQQNGEYSPWPSSNGPALAEPQNDTLEGACAADYSNEEGPSDLPISCHQSCEIGQINLSSIFQILEDSAVSLLKDELKKSEHYLSQGYPVTSELHMEDDNDMDSDEHFQDNSAREGVRMMTRNFLRVMNKHDLADRLEKNELQMACQHKLRFRLKKFQTVFNGKSKQGHRTLFEKTYIEQYITEAGPRRISNEFYTDQFDATSLNSVTQDTTLKCNDFLKYLPWKGRQSRTVMTKGVSGIGKTVTVQKFIFDWAERMENQDIHLVFDLPFRELNLMNDREWSLTELLYHYLPAIKGLEPTNFSNYRVLFIFDGLDECCLPLNFQNNDDWFDAEKPLPLDVLLTNLINGNLFPSAFIWITSRPTAASRIPLQYINLMTELQGFSDPQKQECIKKRFGDSVVSRRVIKQVESCKSLHIMCHVPLFCWISATVLERLSGETDEAENSKTLTQMYTHFMLHHLFHREQVEGQPKLLETEKVVFLKLGQLAFHHLCRASVLFSEDDLAECGIDVSKLMMDSAVCREILKEEIGLCKAKVYSFLHQSFQEYLAALYVFLSNKEKSVVMNLNSVDSNSTMSDLLKNAVDQALQSETGHLDLCLRFLLGLSVDSSQLISHGLLRQLESNLNCIKETICYIKSKLKESLSPERAISLFHCLAEVKDKTLVEEVQAYLNSRSLSAVSLSPAHWSALTTVLLTSDTVLNVFDLKKYISSEECLLRLLPVVKASTTALLNGCDLTEECCKALASAVNSNYNCLKEVDLRYNDLRDSGVKLLSAGLGNPHCKLETLRLSGCRITESGCASLASALCSNLSYLRELDLSYNHPGNTGVKWLSELLKDPTCKLEKLWLMSCGFTEEGFTFLASALHSNMSHVKQLGLSYNLLGLPGVLLLSGVLESPACKLEKLELSLCGITEEGCAFLASALGSNPSHLRELDLSYNDLGDSGAELLSALQQDPKFKLEKLRLLPRLSNSTTSSLAQFKRH